MKEILIDHIVDLVDQGLPVTRSRKELPVVIVDLEVSVIVCGQHNCVVSENDAQILELHLQIICDRTGLHGLIVGEDINFLIVVQAVQPLLVHTDLVGVLDAVAVRIDPVPVVVGRILIDTLVGLVYRRVIIVVPFIAFKVPVILIIVYLVQDILVHLPVAIVIVVPDAVAVAFLPFPYLLLTRLVRIDVLVVLPHTVIDAQSGLADGEVNALVEALIVELSGVIGDVELVRQRLNITEIVGDNGMSPLLYELLDSGYLVLGILSFDTCCDI